MSRNRILAQLPRTWARGLSQGTAAMPLQGKAAQRAIVPLVMASIVTGFAAGRVSVPTHSHDQEEHLVLPNGYPRTCCEKDLDLTEDQANLSKKLAAIVGKDRVLDGRTETTSTSAFLKGARLGRGAALCIVRPDDLNQLVDVVQAVVDADCAILAQGQNTGLTGGSVPRQNADKRPTVLISMKTFDKIFPIDDGDRVVCLAGAGLATLQKYVHTHFGRESHSILGSTFLNPTAAAGIALGSGGTQCRKGPAFTERALYLKIDEDKCTGKKTVKVVNTLGIDGFDQQEGEFDGNSMPKTTGVIARLSSYVREINQDSLPSKMLKSNSTFGQDPASDVDYKERLCQHDHEVSRCNADTRGRECNRSEGKVMILATVHDTFPAPEKSKTFWVSFDSLDTALAFRRDVCLDNPKDLPISIEYMDRGKQNRVA